MQRGIVVALLVAAIAAILWYLPPSTWRRLEVLLDPTKWDEWRDWIRGFGVFAPLVSIAISAGQVVPLPIPAPAVPLANGWLYGPWAGTLVTWIGVMLNAILGYALAHGPGRRLLLRFLDDQHLERAERLVEAHGALAVAVSRFVPVLPFTAVSLTAGLLNMSWPAYFLANAVGILPGAATLGLIGYHLSRGGVPWHEVVTVGLLLVALVFLTTLSVQRFDRPAA